MTPIHYVLCCLAAAGGFSPVTHDMPYCQRYTASLNQLNQVLGQEGNSTAVLRRVPTECTMHIAHNDDCVYVFCRETGATTWLAKRFAWDAKAPAGVSDVALLDGDGGALGLYKSWDFLERRTGRAELLDLHTGDITTVQIRGLWY